MAEKNFAIVDDNNIVTEVMILDVDTEAEGVAEARNIINDQNATVVESFTDGTRYNPAAIGFTWDAANNAFYEPKPFDSWTLDSNYKWQAPTSEPTDTSSINDNYFIVEWNETNTRWEAFDTTTETVTHYWTGSAWSAV
jgi:hypothetical protein